MGAISTNILNGLSAAVVLIGSHIWFCGRDLGQCLDSPKVLGCAVVGLGCVGYALGSGEHSHLHGHGNVGHGNVERGREKEMERLVVHAGEGM